MVADAKLDLAANDDDRRAVMQQVVDVSKDVETTLEKQIKDLGLERHVKLGGFRPDAISLTKSFDIFAMSSVTEGLGSAMLDAMACQTPVVATRAGGIPEAVVDGKSGLLVPPNDDAALAAAIVKLLRDADLRKSLGAAGRARVVEEFSVERMVTKTLGVYEKYRAAAGKTP